MDTGLNNDVHSAGGSENLRVVAIGFLFAPGLRARGCFSALTRLQHSPDLTDGGNSA
jgi:hypothetical protein